MWYNDASLPTPQGFIMSDTARPEGNLQKLRRQIDDAKREYDALDMKPGESLRDFEYRAKQHSDGATSATIPLLSLKVAEKVQCQLLEQDARAAEEQLKKKDS